MAGEHLAHRRGKPVAGVQQLGFAAASLAQAIAIAPLADDARLPWHPDLPDAEPAAPQAELGTAAAARLAATLRGIEAWQTHPWRRSVEDPPAIWSDGSSRLLDYGQAPEAAAPSGLPVLVVPSLINRAWILDLMPGRSFLRALAAAGLRPLLLDWGAPGCAEAGFTLDDYTTERLRPALAACRVLAGAPCPVIGYCMGGTVAAGLTATGARDISRLVTLGAPWNFAGSIWAARALCRPHRADGGARARAALGAIGQVFGATPDIIFQSAFAALDGGLAAAKFRRFAELDPDSDAARAFVAVEDWLNDGIPVATAVSESVLIDWQLNNTPGEGRWHLRGRRADPGRIDIPLLAVCGRRDRIAPPASAEALAAAVRGAELCRPDTGHVGMVVGRAGQNAVLQRILGFLSAA